MRFLAACILSLLSLLGMVSVYASTQLSPERFWIAGRYDGDRVIVYFDAVKFGDKLPPSAVKLPLPVARGFFVPMSLPPSYIAGFQKDGAERFEPGDEYELLANSGAIWRLRLTTLVGFPSDEGVGNDSYIGALGVVMPAEALQFEPEYYVVRRYDAARPKPSRQPGMGASLLRYEVPFAIQAGIAELLRSRMQTELRLQPDKDIQATGPAFVVRAFTLADGTLRYHVQAEWRAGRDWGYSLRHTFAAWLSPEPTLRILATEQLAFGSDGVGQQNILNVVDLGENRTGLIVRQLGGESITLKLVEYTDGARLDQMRELQAISYSQ